MSTNSSEHRLEHWVHWSLLSGLLLSATLLSLGLIICLVSGQPRPLGPPPSVSTILRGVRHSQGVSLIELGLLVLMGTPVLRVAVLALGWLLDREWRFAGVAFTVLGLLAVSVVLGMG